MKTTSWHSLENSFLGAGRLKKHSSGECSHFCVAGFMIPAKKADSRTHRQSHSIAKGGYWRGELRPGSAVRKETPIRAEVIVELSPPMAGV